MLDTKKRYGSAPSREKVKVNVSALTVGRYVTLIGPGWIPLS